MFVDHANEHGSWLDQVDTSNLCLHPDTQVSCIVDNIPMKLSMKELDEIFKQNKSISVLSKDINTQEISYKEVLNSNITGIDVNLIEIIDEETGFEIKCTEDHLIFTKNRGYVKAKDLNESDILDII
jgi:intein/homing endonuclease